MARNPLTAATKASHKTNLKNTRSILMKTLLLSILALGGIGFLCSCTTVEHHTPRTTTTTTEETTVGHPLTGSVETTTYRSN